MNGHANHTNSVHWFDKPAGRQDNGKITAEISNKTIHRVAHFKIVTLSHISSHVCAVMWRLCVWLANSKNEMKTHAHKNCKLRPLKRWEQRLYVSNWNSTVEKNSIIITNTSINIKNKLQNKNRPSVYFKHKHINYITCDSLINRQLELFKWTHKRSWFWSCASACSRSMLAHTHIVETELGFKVKEQRSFKRKQ